MCGEKKVMRGAKDKRMGSPPHVRGKDRLSSIVKWRYRITPACAGKSRTPSWNNKIGGDHPRMCGEKLVCWPLVCTIWGSPPHVRGKAIVPTVPATFPMDHPRMCGEKCFHLWNLVKVLGSPPHVRGKECGNVENSVENGITPACAGKRLKRSRSTVPPVAIVPLFPSVCNKPVASDGSPAGRDAPLFLPAENAVPASPAYNLRSL